MIDAINPIILAFLGSFVIVLIIYLENKINKTVNSNKEYLKLFCIILTIVIIILFIHEMSIFRKNNVSILEGAPDF